MGGITLEPRENVSLSFCSTPLHRGDVVLSEGSKPLRQRPEQRHTATPRAATVRIVISTNASNHSQATRASSFTRSVLHGTVLYFCILAIETLSQLVVGQSISPPSWHCCCVMQRARLPELDTSRNFWIAAGRLGRLHISPFVSLPKSAFVEGPHCQRRRKASAK